MSLSCSAVKEYFKLYPEGFGAEDVYVCESRYSAKSKSFKKIKMWTMPLSSVRFLPRDVPLPVVRVASMFAVKTEEKPAEGLDEEKMEEVNVDKVNVSLSPAVFWVQGEFSLYSLVCACRRGRTFLWTWPTENQAVSTTSSSSTTTPGSKWETLFTSLRMGWCATEWAGEELRRFKQLNGAQEDIGLKTNEHFYGYSGQSSELQRSRWRLLFCVHLISLHVTFLTH